MPKHVFNISEDRAEEAAQKLAHRLAVIAGLQMLHTSDPDDVDLQQLIRKSNIRIQNIIDDL